MKVNKLMMVAMTGLMTAGPIAPVLTQSSMVLADTKAETVKSDKDVAVGDFKGTFESDKFKDKGDFKLENSKLLDLNKGTHEIVDGRVMLTAKYKLDDKELPTVFFMDGSMVSSNTMIRKGVENHHFINAIKDNKDVAVYKDNTIMFDNVLIFTDGLTYNLDRTKNNKKINDLVKVSKKGDTLTYKDKNYSALPVNSKDVKVLPFDKLVTTGDVVDLLGNKIDFEKINTKEVQPLASVVGDKAQNANEAEATKPEDDLVATKKSDAKKDDKKDPVDKILDKSKEQGKISVIHMTKDGDKFKPEQTQILKTDAGDVITVGGLAGFINRNYVPVFVRVKGDNDNPIWTMREYLDGKLKSENDRKDIQKIADAKNGIFEEFGNRLIQNYTQGYKDGNNDLKMPLPIADIAASVEGKTIEVGYELSSDIETDYKDGKLTNGTGDISKDGEGKVVAESETSSSKKVEDSRQKDTGVNQEAVKSQSVSSDGVVKDELGNKGLPKAGAVHEGFFTRIKNAVVDILGM